MYNNQTVPIGFLWFAIFKTSTTALCGTIAIPICIGMYRVKHGKTVECLYIIYTSHIYIERERRVINASKGIIFFHNRRRWLSQVACGRSQMLWGYFSLVVSDTRPLQVLMNYQHDSWLSEHTLTLIWCCRNIAGYRTWHNKTTEFELLCTRPCSHQMSTTEIQTAHGSRGLFCHCAAAVRERSTMLQHRAESDPAWSARNPRPLRSSAHYSGIFGHTKGVGVCQVSGFQHKADWFGSAWCTCELSCGHLWWDPWIPWQGRDVSLHTQHQVAGQL